MPMHQTIAAFAVAALMALLGALFVPRLKADFGRRRFWLGLIASASFLSAVSAWVAKADHAGTGFVTRHGWPKPFWFRFVSEYGERESSFEALYFAGNALTYAAMLLLAWTAWRFVRR
jgi:hypothetical protein